MRRIGALLLAASMMAVPSARAATPIAPAPSVTPVVTLTPFVAEYKLMRDGMHIANARFTLARDGEDGWNFSSETKPAGFVALLRSDVIIEHSAFRMGAERPIPLHYRYEHRGSNKDRDGRYAYDWQRERVTGVYRGKPVDLPLERGTLDPLTLRLAVGLDLARGSVQPLYHVIEKRQLREYALLPQPPQRIRVEAGELEVVGVARVSEDGTRTTRFLYAPANNWAPALMEQSETEEATYRLELVSFRRD